MSNSLCTSHDQFVVTCKRCAVTPALASQLTFQKLPPYIGSEFRRVLILGHSPKVRTSSNIDVTLDLNQPRQLRRYITTEVLAPLGIDLNWCAAINIVRCLTLSIPEDTRVDDLPLMEVAFSYCWEHLIREIAEIRPCLMISLSETVANTLQKATQPTQKTQPMKEIFATLRLLTLGGQNIHWIPVVHIPKPKVRAFYFPEHTQRLTALRDDVRAIILNAAADA